MIKTVFSRLGLILDGVKCNLGALPQASPLPVSHQRSRCRDEWTESLRRYNIVSTPHLSAYNLWPTGQVKTVLHTNTMSYIMHYCTANAFKHCPLAVLVIGDLLTWVMRIFVPNVPYSRRRLRSEKRERERESTCAKLDRMVSPSFSVKQRTS